MAVSQFPASFAKLQTTVKKPKFKRLVIATQGGDNVGKTEFILSMPGPGTCTCVDRGYEGTMENLTPPEERNKSILIIPYNLAHNKEKDGQDEYKADWIAFKKHCYECLDNTDSISAAIDGGSDAYELLRLAVHGRLEKVPSMAYADSDALWKAFLARHYESGKNIIITHKMKDEYVSKLDPITHKPVGDEKVKSGVKIRQGHRDHEYLYTIQLEHLFEPAETSVIESGPRAGKMRTITNMRWGIKLIRCKMNRALEGTVLWSDKGDCNFQGLIKLIYPGRSLSEWGY